MHLHSFSCMVARRDGAGRPLPMWDCKLASLRHSPSRLGSLLLFVILLFGLFIYVGLQPAYSLIPRRVSCTHVVCVHDMWTWSWTGPPNVIPDVVGLVRSEPPSVRRRRPRAATLTSILPHTQTAGCRAAAHAQCT